MFLLRIYIYFSLINFYVTLANTANSVSPPDVFLCYKPHGARDLSNKGKIVEIGCAFWSYSVRKENPTYFYIVEDNKGTFCAKMANYVAARSVRNMLKNNSVRSTTVMNNHAIPSSHPLPLPCDSENDFRGTSDSIMLRSLRIAVTPSHAQGSYEVPIQSSACSSTLAGDPKRLRHCQDIRAEILEKWNTKPKPDPTQREWIKSIMYNTVAP